MIEIQFYCLLLYDEHKSYFFSLLFCFNHKATLKFKRLLIIKISATKLSNSTIFHQEKATNKIKKP